LAHSVYAKRDKNDATTANKKLMHKNAIFETTHYQYNCKPNLTM